MPSSEPITSNSKVIGVTPVIDKDPVKVGAIRHANILKDSKQQNILSKDRHFTQILSRNIHELNLHVGKEHTIAIIRNQLSHGRIRGILRNCILYLKGKESCQTAPL